MAKTSKEILDKAGILPRLILGEKLEGGGVQSTGPHKVTFVSDRGVEGKDFHSGKMRPEVLYIFEEDGQEKEYRVPVKTESDDVHYFVKKMAEIYEGTELTLEMRKKGTRNYISVVVEGKGEVRDDEEVHFDEGEEPSAEQIEETFGK